MNTVESRISINRNILGDDPIVPQLKKAEEEYERRNSLVVPVFILGTLIIGFLSVLLASLLTTIFHPFVSIFVSLFVGVFAIVSSFSKIEKHLVSKKLQETLFLQEELNRKLNKKTEEELQKQYGAEVISDNGDKDILFAENLIIRFSDGREAQVGLLSFDRDNGMKIHTVTVTEESPLPNAPQSFVKNSRKLAKDVDVIEGLKNIDETI